MSIERWRAYRKDDEHSYVMGVYPSFRLLETSPERCIQVLMTEDLKEREKAEDLATKLGVPYEIAPRAIERISKRQNYHMLAVIKKEAPRAENRRQVLLDEVDDMGNLGTIIRTMLAFEVRDLCLVGNCCDLWDPRVIRATMGAFFQMRISFFPNLEAWRAAFPERKLGALLLDKEAEYLRQGMEKLSSDEKDNLTLAFGNEGAGLGRGYQETADYKWIIPQSSEVDSLNLAEAASIALYEWSQ